jgi:competence protein ComEC
MVCFVCYTYLVYAGVRGVFANQVATVVGVVFYLAFGQFVVKQAAEPTEVPELQNRAVYWIEVKSALIPTTHGYKATVVILGPDTRLQHLKPGAVIYFRKLPAETFKLGDQYLFCGKFSRVKPTGNPFSFEYSDFLSRQHIYYQAYGGILRQVNRHVGFSIFRQAEISRAYLLGIYQQYGLSGEEFAVASALSLGYKNALDPDIKLAFSESGAMHVLAVSGLHVGIVYALSLWLFGLFRLRFVNKFIAPILTLAVVWGFVFLSGFAASSQRAAIMLSLIALGGLMGSARGTFNKLSFTALVMLIAKPSDLTDIGFQLSFVAVASILYFQPHFEKVFYAKNKFLNAQIQLVNMSVAAQLGTGFLGIFYFHQFPNYFILTNLIIIPLAPYVIYLGGLLFVCSSFSSMLAKLIVWILHYLLQFVLFSVKTIAALPGSTWHDLYMSSWQLGIALAALGLFVIWIQARQIGYILAMLALFVGVYAISVVQSIQNATSSELVVFQMHNKSLIYLRNKSRTEWLTDTLVATWSQYRYVCGGFATARHIELSPEMFQLSNRSEPDYRIRNCGSTKILILYSDFLKHKSAKKKFAADILILSRGTHYKLQELQATLNFSKLIIDPSVGRKQSLALEQQCLRADQPYQLIAETGAFQLQH